MSKEKNILIVDDSNAARIIIIQCFKIAGFSDAMFLEAGNGREALDILKIMNVSMVVTDYNMPIMDGGVLLKWIKGSPKISTIPVVVISSMQNASRENELLESGATAVIAKPVTPEIIYQKLKEFINKDEQL